jgi:peptidoglycan hydrolase-like protein with peptidoglycan-binding domain
MIENAIPFGHLYQSEALIEAAQLALRTVTCGGWELSADGINGARTTNAIKIFQVRNRLEPTGQLNAATLKQLYVLAYPKADIYNGSPCYYDGTGTAGEKQEVVKKKAIVLHHSVSDRDGRKVNRFFSDKGYGTAYALSGNGTIIQLFADQDNWSWHLNMREDNKRITQAQERKVAQETVAIEICSFGELDQIKGKYYNTYGTEVPANEVCTLAQPFRGAKYFHCYTPAQIAVLEVWIRHLLNRYQLTLTPQVIDTAWFDYNVNPILQGTRPLFTHTNCRTSKSDLFPQPELIAMLQRLYTLPVLPGQ